MVQKFLMDMEGCKGKAEATQRLIKPRLYVIDLGSSKLKPEIA
jgi:hypothetical protein